MLQHLPEILAALVGVGGSIGAYLTARRKRAEDREDVNEREVREALKELAEVKAVAAANAERIAYLDRTLARTIDERDAARARADAATQYAFELRLWGRDLRASALAAGATNLPPEPTAPPL